MLRRLWRRPKCSVGCGGLNTPLAAEEAKILRRLRRRPKCAVGCGGGLMLCRLRRHKCSEGCGGGLNAAKES